MDARAQSGLEPARQPSALAAGGPSEREIRERLADIEADASLDADLKASLADLYRRALDLLQTESKERERARDLGALLSNSSREVERLNAEIDALEAGPAAPPSAASLPSDPGALARHQSQTEAALAELRGAAAELEAQISNESGRPSAARAEKAAAQAALDKVSDVLSQPLPVNETQALYDARTLVLSARKRRTQAELGRLEQEIASHDVRMELLDLQRKKVALELSAAEERAAAVERRVNEQRRNEAASAEREAERQQAEAEGKSPVLGKAASVNAELAREHRDAAAEIARLSQERQRVEERASRIKEDSEIAARRADVAAASEVLGRYLRDQRSRLGNPRTFEREAALRQQKIAELSLRQIEISEVLRALEKTDQAAYAIFLEGARTDLMPADRAAVLKDLTAILQDRKRMLDDLSRAYSDKLRAMTDLEFAYQQLAEVSSSYRQFLDERLLWVPSSGPIGPATLDGLGQSVAWLFSTQSWSEAAAAVTTQARRNFGQAVIVAILVGALFGVRGRLRRRVLALSGKMARAETDRFSHTAEVLAISVLIAIAWPLLLGAIGYGLREAVAAPEFARALGAGALDGALMLAAGNVLIQICRPQGLAESHFRWPASSLRLMRRNLAWWVPLTTVAIFVFSMMSWQSNPALNAGLGRLAFVVQTLALATLMFVLLRPRRGLFTPYILRRRDSWVSRLRNIWFTAAVLVPVALAMLALAGYQLTAVGLENRVMVSTLIVISAILTYSLSLRALHVTRRHIEYDRIVQKRQNQPTIAPQALAAGESHATMAAAAAAAEERPDLESLNEQTLHLLKVVLVSLTLAGLYFAWADILPALTALSNVELWRYSVEIDGAPTTIPVTLQSILLVAIIGILATVAAKNLPAALEIAVLQQLPIDAGLRYAIKTVSQYVIVAVGIVLILSDLGVGWSNIQWLVAALSVGLGFGLQEIVANFVSGLIILFERPIRIGDVVTVGDSTGTVTKVRIRATTLLDFDNKELIVPNKTFITDRLTNWSLSSAVTRVLIPIGIAYGTDVETARQVILDAVKDHPLIVDEPPLSLFFTSLGESSLDFRLYLYVRTPSERMVATDAILARIYAALTAAGIEIPFPQRDINLRDIDRLEDSLRNRARDTGEAPAGAPPAGGSEPPR